MIMIPSQSASAIAWDAFPAPIPRIAPWQVSVSAFLLALFVGAGSTAAVTRSVETRDLIVRDPKQVLSSAELAAFADSGQTALERILDFWSTSARLGRFGKIRLDYYRPKAKRGVAVFGWRKEKGRRVRVVSVWGKSKDPEMLTQKLTHAVFPNPDKLLRNMLSIVTEAELGNIASFPMCGFDSDAWVLALRDLKSSVGLAEMGPSHQSWGMGERSGIPYVKDIVRQQVTYSEAASFGAYLVKRFGIDAMKTLNQKSASKEFKERPWKPVFGMTLGQLEAEWIEALESAREPLKEQVSRLVRLWKRDRKNACLAAQRSAAKNTPTRKE